MLISVIIVINLTYSDSSFLHVQIQFTNICLLQLNYAMILVPQTIFKMLGSVKNAQLPIHAKVAQSLQQTVLSVKRVPRPSL